MTRTTLRTVVGDVDVSGMGSTLTHEHLFISGDSHWEQTGSDPDPSPTAEPAISDLWRWRENLDGNRSNLRLDDEAVAKHEVSLLRSFGYNTLLDLTTIGLGRRPDALRRVAEATGLNIVAGTGFYSGATLPDDVATWDEDRMVETMVRDIEVGIDGTDIKAGVIGEVGISWPIKPVEQRSLAASVEAMRRTGAAMSIHTPFHKNDVSILEEISDSLRSLGADMSRVVLGHCDTYTTNPRFFDVASDLGCVLQIDMFGNSGYESAMDFHYPSDEQRIAAVLRLIEMGLADRLMISQDCGLKTCLRSYGGHGYDYIPRVIAPRLRREVAQSNSLELVLEKNAQRIFPLATTPSA